MSKHYITLSIFLSIFFVLFIASGFLFAAHAVTVTNFGFIQGNIWYSKDPFYDNDKIRIYTGVFNGSSEDITGTVEFYDNDKVIGRADFSIAAGGKLQEVWTDWIATQGQHKISAKITQAKASRILGGDKEITLTNNQSGQDNRVIVIDPAVLAAAAASTATASSTATPLPALVNQLLDKTPPAVASGAKTIINGINALAEAAAAKLDKTAAVLRQEIAQAKSSASSSANSTLMAKNAPAKVLPKTAATSTHSFEPPVWTGSASSSPADNSLIIKEVQLGVVSGLAFALKQKFILYPVLLIIAYQVLKFLFRLLFRRKREL